jgi:hypothetical protein
MEWFFNKSINLSIKYKLSLSIRATRGVGRHQGGAHVSKALAGRSVAVAAAALI